MRLVASSLQMTGQPTLKPPLSVSTHTHNTQTQQGTNLTNDKPEGKKESNLPSRNTFLLRITTS